MFRRWFSLGIVLPALLIGLVGALAALQYRWLGQVSEAERAQLSRSLTQRAQEMADDFDREITRLYLALQIPREAAADGSWRPFADSLQRWRNTSKYPQLVRGLYLAEPAGNTVVLRPWDAGAGAFAATSLQAWPAHLEPLRPQLEAEPALPPDVLAGTVTREREPAGATGHPGMAHTSTVRVVAMAQSPVATEVPALVIPLTSPVLTFPAGRTPAGSPRTGPSVPRFALMRLSVIVDLDDRFFSDSFLPSLAERYFPSGQADSYRLAVLSAAGRTRYQRGFDGSSTIDAKRADVAVPLFTLRFDIAREGLRPASSGPGPVASSVTSYSVILSSAVRPQAAGAASNLMVRALPARPGWTLVLQHNAGSLDIAVLRARRRNLLLSFGILGVLALGLLLVVSNARRSEQLAAKQMDFVATVSHELRTPLAVIRSAAQNLSAGVVADPQQARRYGELIEGEGRRLTDMVEQVLDYAGLEGQRRVRAPRPVDVPALVEDVAESCRPACEAAGCVLDVDLGAPDAEVPAVMGDEAALGRVVTNLITNAAKHGAAGRWVGVTVTSCVVASGREVHIAVSDRGRGVEASELEHIFEPFRRGRRAIDGQVRGNGLGLSLVKRVVDAHGGRVAVTSAPGQGATFVVYLPAEQAAPVANAESEP